MEVNVLTDSMIIYNTNIVSFMGPVKITQQAHHYQISELLRDSTDTRFLHKYKPKSGYIGKDSVLIKHEKINDTSHEIMSNTYLTVVLNIVEK